MDVPVRVLGEAHRGPIELEAVRIDQVVIRGVGAGEPDHPPGDHVTVAAIDRVAEEAFERALPEVGEEYVRGYAAEILPARFEVLEITVLCVGAHLREWRVGQFLVDGTQRGSKQFGRSIGELVSLAGCAGLPGTTAIESLARAPSARQLLVDVIWHAGFERAGPFFIGRD